MLLLGFGLGLRHATDADHLVVITGLLQRGPGLRGAVRVAALWGLGHSAAFLMIGLLVVVADLRPTPAFEVITNIMVAGMLIALGAAHLIRVFTSSARAAFAAPGRPMVVGVVHGLAGSAAVALVAATSISSRGSAVAYLLLFGLGTVVGMITLTVLLAGSLGWALRGRIRLADRLTVASALLSVALGAFLGAMALADHR